MTVRSPWITVGVVLLGSYAFVLNGHVIGVALPTLAADLGARSSVDVDWVVTSFLVGVVFALPATGWLADRFGRRQVYVSALSIFGAGSLICLVSPNLEVLLVGRFLQGFGGGTLIPIGMATVFDLFPPERRGRAMSVWGVAVMAGPAAGPPIGGFLVTVAHWRWIFVGFALVALVAATLSNRFIEDVGHREDRELDLVGWGLAAAGVTTVVLGARQVTSWGPWSLRTVTTAVVACALLTTLVRRSNRHSSPIVQFRIFTVPVFAIAMAVTASVALAQYARVNFAPIELQVVRGLDAQTVGLLLTPGAIGVAAAMPFGGWLVDRVGARIPVTGGLCLLALGMWRLAHISTTDPEIDVVIALVIQGVGSGLANIPTTVTAMNSLPAKYVSQASAMNALNRQLAGALGIAVLSSALVSQLGSVAPVSADPAVAQTAYNNVFLIAFWFVVVSASLALFLPGSRAARAHRQVRIDELRSAASQAGSPALS